MLKLLTGRAGTGKTAAVLENIRQLANAGKESILIVPEQYSHDAERQLCAVCGNTIALYSEVISFSSLTRRLWNVCGKKDEKPLSKGGKLLVMERAFVAVSGKLTTFAKIRRRSDFLESLISLHDELSQSMLSPNMLISAAGAAEEGLKNKVDDLALIMEAYDATIPEGWYDPAARPSQLAELIRESGAVKNKSVFIDGFSDFTAQQLPAIEEMLIQSQSLTVSLNCEDIQEDDILFSSAKRTRTQLKALAAEHFEEVKEISMLGNTRQAARSLRYLERHLFSQTAEQLRDEFDGAIRLIKTSSAAQECESAASAALDSVRNDGLRWRDIAVTARGWESYATAAEEIFEKYGIPVLMNQRSSILEKPVLLMVVSALETIENGYAYMDIFRYLKTGLAGVKEDECDELENYVLMHKIRGFSMWNRDEGWTADPRESGVCKPQNSLLLARINSARRKVIAPLKILDEGLNASQTARGKIYALWEFLCAAGVPEKLEKRARELGQTGQLQSADEYLQLWDILVDAMEQFSGILGDIELDSDEFLRLLKLYLSSCDIGTIPAALDRVSMGEMDRMRKRDLKCLIVLGATDENLPRRSSGTGLLSDEDRDVLMRGGLRLKENAEGRLLREMDLIYSSLTLPSQKLVLIRNGSSGNRPSFAITRIGMLFGIEEEQAGSDIYTCAPKPCFEFAVSAMNTATDAWAAAALEIIKEDGNIKDRLESAQRAAALGRRSLSHDSAQKLYGKELILTASRVECYFTCRYSYFMEYGLEAKPRKTADFEKPELGSFVHYVLEKVLDELEELGGIKENRNLARELAVNYTMEYAERHLGGLDARDARFRYLFRRLAERAVTIVEDTVEELSRSDFRPLDYELSFGLSNQSDIPAGEIDTEEGKTSIIGVVDRADGWEKDGKLYIRIVDYKTGKKEFRLSDVLNGISMQMLIYLFILERNGEAHYGTDSIVPAGILYTPARDPVITAQPDTSEETLVKERMKKLKRSGLVLYDENVIEAMEHGDKKTYIPVKMKKDGSIDTNSDSIATLEQMGILSRQVDELLREMASGIRNGSISSRPLYHSNDKNACKYCEFMQACRFGDYAGDKINFAKTMKSEDAWKAMEADDGKT